MKFTDIYRGCKIRYRFDDEEVEARVYNYGVALGKRFIEFFIEETEHIAPEDADEWYQPPLYWEDFEEDRVLPR